MRSETGKGKGKRTENWSNSAFMRRGEAVGLDFRREPVGSVLA